MGTLKTLIKLENITFAYPDSEKKILNNLDLEFFEGDRLGMMAPNGSGKTTLFHTIMGLCKPESGKIKIFDKEVKTEKDFSHVRTKIGLLFQDSDDQLFSPTVLEDVVFGPLNLGYSAKEAMNIAKDILGQLGISDLEKNITHRLSGGQKRLVALAAVLAMRPLVLLLDEPTAGLDESFKHKLITILNQLDVSYILISHEFDFINKATNKVFSMEKGQILTDDDIHVHHHEHVHKHGKQPHVHK